jgi:hypothetical protein
MLRRNLLTKKLPMKKTNSLTIPEEAAHHLSLAFYCEAFVFTNFSPLIIVERSVLRLCCTVDVSSQVNKGSVDAFIILLSAIAHRKREQKIGARFLSRY